MAIVAFLALCISFCAAVWIYTGSFWIMVGVWVAIEVINKLKYCVDSK